MHLAAGEYHLAIIGVAAAGEHQVVAGEALQFATGVVRERPGEDSVAVKLSAVGNGARRDAAARLKQQSRAGTDGERVGDIQVLPRANRKRRSE